MLHKNQHGASLLAGTTRTTGPERAAREHVEREELRTLYLGMVPKGKRPALGSRRWRFDDAAPNTAKRNPLGELLADADAAISAGGREAEVCAPFDRLASLVRARCRAAAMLPDAVTLEIAETREQGEADVAVRVYLAEPEDSPRKRELLGAAVRELMEHANALGRLTDKLHEDRVLKFPPRLTLSRGGR